MADIIHSIIEVVWDRTELPLRELQADVAESCSTHWKTVAPVIRKLVRQNVLTMQKGVDGHYMVGMGEEFEAYVADHDRVKVNDTHLLKRLHEGEPLRVTSSNKVSKEVWAQLMVEFNNGEVDMVFILKGLGQ